MPITPEVKVQNLFTTTFVGLAREGHPLFDGEITAARFASYSHISISRRGIARGPIDTALNAQGLERRVAMIAPGFHGAMFMLPDSDLILPQVHPPRGTHHTALVEQGVEGDQQVHVR